VRDLDYDEVVRERYRYPVGAETRHWVYLVQGITFCVFCGQFCFDWGQLSVGLCFVLDAQAVMYRVEVECTVSGGYVHIECRLSRCWRASQANRGRCCYRQSKRRFGDGCLFLYK
jgi:hypothetical protein